VEKVLSKAVAMGVPIRIGVNAGRLPAELRDAEDAGTMSRAEALVSAAERELAIFDEFHFDQVLVSVKASSAGETLSANRLLAEKLGRRNSVPPLHVGVTEAGPLIPGVVRNTLALHALLSEGIGDTIRVSLSDTMENEVIAGREILNSTAASGASRCPPGVTIISCPRCGRNGFDTHDFSQRWQDVLYALEKNCTIAIMGCIVNGPGEGRHADLGICGAGNKVQLFRRGTVIRTIEADQADAVFREELDRLLADI
jgi:(E)-4-hydroxy-3-methylbut-2-enyl-diphosphate synthase